jgi:uncharacterized metal-binding protein
MSSVGTLTAMAMLEAYKRLDHERFGLFCTSAIAAGIPKHRRSTDNAESIIAIDGCYNHCTQKILESAGLHIDKYLNLLHDLKIPKLGPFRPFDYTEDNFNKAVSAIMDICEQSTSKHA